MRVVDPSTHTSTHGASIADCLQGSSDGREVIVAVSQRSAFIRSLYVPNGSKSDIAKLLDIQMDRLLPLKSQEYVFGFRLGAEEPGKGRLAVVGAVKGESLQRIYSEARQCGLTIRAVLPLAFGSWLAARANSMANCAVVGAHGDALSIDLVRNGELTYSRSIPLPESAADIDDEVDRTFSIAEVDHSPVLSARCPGIESDFTDDKESIEYLADAKTIDRLIFSFELPEKAAAVQARSIRWKTQRSLLALTAALGLGGYAYVVRAPAQAQSNLDTPALKSLLAKAQTDHAAAKKKSDEVVLANTILDVAFKPGQSFGDMITVLANSATPASWFTALFIGRGQPISIDGLALNDADAAKFVDDISKDSRFQEMKVVSTTRATIGKKQVTQFQISGKPMGSLSFDHPPKGVKRT